MRVNELHVAVSRKQDTARQLAEVRQLIRDLESEELNLCAEMERHIEEIDRLLDAP